MRLGACDLIGFVPVTDGERARWFYVDVLGLEFVQDDGFAVVLRAGGRSVRLAAMAAGLLLAAVGIYGTMRSGSARAGSAGGAPVAAEPVARCLKP